MVHKQTSNTPSKIIFPVLAGLIVIVLIVGGCFLYVYGLGGNLFGWSASSSTEQNKGESDNAQDSPAAIDENPPTDEQTGAGKDIKEHSLDQGDTDSDNKSDTSISVSAKIADDKLRIRTTIRKVTNSGTCSLTLSKGSTTLNYSAGTQAVTSYSVCKGFDIDTSSLTSGTWKVEINYKDNSGSTGAASTSIEL